MEETSFAINQGNAVQSGTSSRNPSSSQRGDQQRSRDGQGGMQTPKREISNSDDRRDGESSEGLHDDDAVEQSSGAARERNEDLDSQLRIPK